MRQRVPRATVVVVDHRGAPDSIACLRALGDDLRHPDGGVRLVCVDNGGGTADEIAAAVPDALVVRSATNLGFAGGANLGARHATGDVVAFLNNDARPHADWLAAAVAVLDAEPAVAAVASKVLDAAGERIDFAGGGLTWFGQGYEPHAGERDDGSHDVARDVLFGTGAALVVRRSAFDAVGGFDERFFMFYEDVDLGWRLTLRGWRVRYEPRSVAYHRHHGSLAGADPAREAYLLERNALAALYKNVSDETLSAALPAALALVARRATARAGLDPAELELTRRPADGPDGGDAVVPRVALAGLYAVDRFVELLPSLRESRAVEQAARVRTDADLVPLMRSALERLDPHEPYLLAHDALVSALGVEEVYGARRRVLVLTADAVGERRAGPAIRAWHVCEVLAAEHDVRLVSLNRHTTPVAGDGFDVRHVPARAMADELAWAQLVVLQGHVLEQVPELKTSSHVVVVDVYDPMHLELLEQGRDGGLGDDRAAVVRRTTDVLTAQLRRGDFLLCASERQRHFWLGHLAAIGRLTPALYDADPTTRALLDVAPFGLPAKPPQRTGARGLREHLGYGADELVLLWGGGVYSWFDPLTLLHAVDRLRRAEPRVRLVFLGMRHPNPDVPEMGVAADARRLADQLGLDGHVVFNETWVPYESRADWLLDADCGVTTHAAHVETTFAFRTRVLDYLWAGLPVVTTDGDAFAELVRAERLGLVVPPGDPDALAAALHRVLTDAEFAAGCRERVAVVAQRYTWEAALAPLVRFVRSPRPAADRLPGVAPVPVPWLRRDAALVRDYLADGGVREVARRATGRVRRVAGRLAGR